ncbi:MAG: DUF1643 domain-containing protein [Dehalococcoidia bacterium]
MNSSVDILVRANTAHFSECGQFRYLLTREFGGESTCLFVMLNPSTADAERNDPTIRRCISFARREGFGRLEVVNIYAFRSASPSVLFAAEDPVGAANDTTIAAALDRANLVIAAWGNHAESGRVAEVIGLIASSGKLAKCFGLTKRKQPKHPLYLRVDVGLVDYLAI